MIRRRVRLPIVCLCVIASVVGCDKATTPVTTSAPVSPTPWLGIPSAVNQVIVFLHDGTGWLLNKSEVSVKKSGDVRTVEPTSNERVLTF